MAEETTSDEQATNKTEVKAEMSFLDHLETLRWHIIKSAIAVCTFAILAFINSKFIFDNIIMAPKQSDFWTSRMIIKLSDFFGIQSNGLNNKDLQLINLDMSGQFNTDVWTAIVVGFIVASPYVVYQFWSFVKPALYENERRHASGAVLVMSALFILGDLFGYYLIAPFSIDWLGSYQISDQIINQINVKSYMSMVTSIVLSGGIAFELPVVVFFLSKIGLLTPLFLRKYRRHAYVVLLIVAAIITPPDVLSQTIVCIPLVILYEISIFISARVDRENKRRLEEI